MIVSNTFEIYNQSSCFTKYNILRAIGGFVDNGYLSIPKDYYFYSYFALFYTDILGRANWLESVLTGIYD